MNLLDMRTVLLGYVISNVLCAAVLASLWWQNRRRSPELGFWLADFIMQFAGLVLVVGRGFLPDFLSMVVSNTLVIGGTILLLIGLQKYIGRPGPQWHNYIYLALFLSVHTYFVYGLPSLQARNINASLGLLVICSQCAWLLLGRVEPALRSITRPVGVVFVIFSMVSLARIFIDLVIPTGNDLFKSGLFDTLVVLTYQMLYLSLTFTLFLMVNRRLFTALENDILERKLAEELVRSEKLLSDSLINSLPGIFYLFNEYGRFLRWNANFERVSGYSPTEMESLRPLDLFAGDERILIQQRIQKVFAEGQADAEVFLVSKSGVRTPYYFTGLCIKLRGEPCLLGVGVDITERKQAEDILRSYSEHLETEVGLRTRELREAQEKLVRQDRLATLGKLAGSVSHELRNPLGVIANAVYFLKVSQSDASDKVKEYLGIIENETRTSEKIISDLLDFARIKSVDREPIFVSELVQRVLTRFPAPASVKVIRKIPAHLARVFADPRQMEQVLGNLSVNACQAMPEGGKLTFSARQEGQMVAVAVKDSGVGIPPENMEKLFEPLFTTKTKGIGLGLAVCKIMAEANGGRIEVQSEPGAGSTFTLYLPVQEVAHG